MSMELEIALRSIENEKRERAQAAVAKVREIRERFKTELDEVYKREEEAYSLLRAKLGEDVYRMARGMEVRSRKE